MSASTRHFSVVKWRRTSLKRLALGQPAAASPFSPPSGWFHVTERIAVSNWPTEAIWALYHPHFRREPHPKNFVYVSGEHLVLPGSMPSMTPGAGLVHAFTPKVQLTEPLCSRAGLWLLAEWFHPSGRGSNLTYHGDPARWQKSKGGVMLDSVSRGQEFVLDCDDYPEAVKWLRDLLVAARRTE